MIMMYDESLPPIIIVEGKTDRQQLEKIINGDVTIACTYGTLGVERFDELLETYHLDDRRVIILVDEDNRGIELRQQLQRELSHAEHIYITSDFKEVATTPPSYLAMELVKKNIEIKSFYLR